MSKQLNINLGFTADTSQATAAITKLSMELQQLSSSSTVGNNLPINAQLLKAQGSAKELAAVLKSSFNVDTGKLDLNKFNSSLQASGKTLSSYGHQLGMLGTKGDQAFLQLSQAIVQTEIPLRRSSTLLTQFATTLKNTARWQLSSSLLHGFIGAISSAYNYSKDLNESLNNIRIVTGYSSDKMGEFAIQANKAAKALSTTTNEYAKASLIYFQQGLNDSEVKERTDVTIKMANVSRQSAEIVSDQMTAVWNNFDDGSKSLEYFADVMVELGAKTASSSDEIAGGLEKFAAVGETIGLSFEYAASALATITANTRQSEEVVGTALKTIFARIQGLKLGETLEDGVTLNKYSEALQSVGISIFDQNSQLKDMDTILDEMGSKWDTMSKAQQAALAQTVAGVRQYNQLMSLMSNWDDMQSNLELSYGATGALEEQNKRFEESWEASSNRVRASLESIWGALIYDEFFINLNNAFADLLDFFKQIIDAAGGLKGVLAGVALILTSVFKEQMATGINNMIHNFRVFSGAAVADMQKVKKEAYDMSMAMTKGLGDDPFVMALRSSLQTTYTLQTELNEKIKAMSPEQAKAAREAIKIAENYNQIVIEMAQAVKKSEELYQNQNKIANQNLGNKAQEKIIGLNDLAFSQGGGQLLNTSQQMINMAKNMSDVEGMGVAIDNVTRAMQSYRTAMRNNEGTEAMTQRANILIDALNHLTETAGTSAQGFEEYQSKLRSSAETVVNAAVKFNDVKFGPDQNLTKEKIASLKEFAKVAEQTGIPVESLSKALSNFSNKGNFKGNIKDQAAALEALKQALIETTVSEEAMTRAIANRAKGNIQGSGTTKQLTEDEMQLANIIRQLIVDEKSFENGLRGQGQAAKEASNKIKEVGLAYKSIGSATTGLFQGLSSFGMGISSLMSLWDTLKNPDLSGFEKALQIMISFGMAIPMVTTGLSSFVNAIRFVTTTQNEGLTIQLASLLGLEKEEEGIKKIVILKSGEKIARNEVTEERWEELIAQEGSIVNTEAETKAVWKNIGAKMAQYSWLLLIVAGLAVLGTGLTVASNLYNADAIAAEEAAEAAKNASQAFDEAQSAYEKFKSSIDDYSNAIKGMNDLEKGTAAYTEQLIKANDAAMDLINSQNLISGEHYKVNADTGLIEFLPGQFEEIQRQQLSNLESAQAYRAFADQRSKTAQAKANQTEFNREKLKGKGWSEENTASAVGGGAAIAGGYLVGAGISAAVMAKTGTAIGTAIGTALVPGVGSAIGATIGLAVGGLVAAGMLIAAELNESTGEEKKAVQALQQEAKKRGDNSIFEKSEMEAFLRAQGEFSDDLIKSMVENNTAIQQQVEALNINTEAIRASIEQGAGAVNRDNALYQGLGTTPEQQEKYQNLADKIISNRADDILADEDNDVYKEARSKNEDLFKGKWWNTDDSAAYEKYLQARFGDEAENYQVVNQGGKAATLQRKNEEGTWENVGEKNSLTNDEVLDYLTQYDLSQMTKQDKTTLDNIIKVEDTISKNVDIADKDALTEISSGLAEGKPLDLSLMDPQEVEELKIFLSEGGAELGNKLGQDYVDALNQAVNNYDPQALKARMEQESKAILEQGAADLEMTSEALEAYTKDLMKNNKELKDNKKLAAEAAVESAKFGNSLDKLEKSLNDNIKAINKEKNAVEKSLDYYEALGKVQRSFEEAFGVEVDSEFITENLDKIQKAAKGDIAAIDELRKALMDDIIANIILENGLDETATTNVMNAYNTLKANMPDLEVGASLDSGPFIDALNQLILAAGMTTPQVNEMLSGMGMSATFASEPQKITKREPDETTTHVRKVSLGTSTGNDGEQIEEYDIITTTVTKPGKEVEGTVDAYALETSEPGTKVVPKIESITKNPPPIKTNRVSNPSGSGNGGGGGGGGGGSKPKKTSEAKKDKTDIVDRYKEVNDQLAKTQRLMDKNSTLADTLWGPDKIKKIQENTEALKEENKWLQEKIRLQEQYLKEDKGELVKAASDVGLNFEFGEDGTILNYTTEMTKLYDQREAMLVGFGDEMDEAEQEALDKLDEKIDAVTDAYETYDETLNEGFDFDQEKLENEIEQMENRFEEIELKLEVEVELNENDIADIEHQLARLGDNNVYASAERIAVIQKNAISYRNIADAQIEAMREAERLYAAGEISQENYMARLQESKEALQEVEMSIRDSIQQIGEELSNTFDLVDEKLDQQFNKFDQMIELMDHYKNVVSLSEGEASYTEFNKILKASQEVLRDRIAADESEVAMWKARREQLEAEMEGMDKNSPEYLAAEEAYDNILEKEEEAKSQLMADIEQLGEYAQEIFENAIEQAKKDFEAALFDYTMFEGWTLSGVIENIEMLNAKQEEVLTTTNKIYETNKLIRSVEKDIEATTNNRAKQAYAEFQNKVKQKQEQNELTKFELDLLTAEYEITKAQIALEEAQNAKDTVRLTRDSEGNYGYVYTANEDKVNDAEQALEDATNSYYNTALEGAQKYQDQIYQHIEEWEEKVTEVMANQTLSEKEKDERIREINNTYDTLITQDKELFYMAKAAMEETSYQHQADYDLLGIESAENWFLTSDGFIEDLKTAQNEYDIATGEVKQHTVDNFGEMSGAIETTTDKSEELRKKMTDPGGLVDTFDNVVKKAIENTTLAWQEQADALREVIKLTDEAMKKNHDAQLEAGYKEDYAAEISKRLANGADYTDYDIQQLLQYRWDKMGGVDDTDYSALIAAGGTTEQIALWEVLRRFKIDKTDWSSIEGDWAKEIRATKMDQNFAQLIIDYFESSTHARWSDETVQGYLAARQAKINENHEKAKGAMSNEELKKYVAQQMGKEPEQLKTGGYTGSWGPEGKLAVLHEKELVLNAEDTKNFLSATGILREISQMLDRDALIASLGAINLRAMTLNSPADQVLQQEVTIHADFPNVTDHNEIELAIDNLINAASQHAYRT